MSSVVQRMLPNAGLPLGTLTVNLVGCFVIGMLAGISESREIIGVNLRFFLMVGMLGGFTTFSTFGFEIFAMLRSIQPLPAIFSITLHLAIGLLAVWAGHSLATR